MLRCRGVVLAVVLAAVSCLVALPGPGAAEAPARQAAAWLPPTGPVFNDPTGDASARRRVITVLHQAIRRTPVGGTIKLASYNLDRRDTADLLVGAHRRGVNVQVVVDDNLIGITERRLRRVLGGRIGSRSFLVVCTGACRTAGNGTMHLKVTSFSRAGAANHLVISGSANVGRSAVANQWNDAYAVHGDRGLYDAWSALFDQLKRDRTATPRHLTYTTESLRVAFQRRLAGHRGTATVSRAGSGDPVVDRLARVGCRAPSGYGARGRTVMRVNMYAWYGDRGERIARRLARLDGAGCRIAVIGSVISDPVVGILRRARIRVRVADWDWGQKPATSGKGQVFGPRCYSHMKYWTVDGTYAGKAARTVFTGSENWSAPSRGSDEVTLEIRDGRVLRAYNTRWQRMYDSRNATHRPYVKPTRRPCA